MSYRWVEGDAVDLPYPDCYFDAITIGYGLRNVVDKYKAMKEVYRVLKPGSKASILDFNKSTDEFRTSIQVCLKNVELLLINKRVDKNNLIHFIYKFWIFVTGMDDRQYSCACSSWIWSYRGVSISKELNSRIFNRFVSYCCILTTCAYSFDI